MGPARPVRRGCCMKRQIRRRFRRQVGGGRCERMVSRCRQNRLSTSRKGRENPASQEVLMVEGSEQLRLQQRDGHVLPPGSAACGRELGLSTAGVTAEAPGSPSGPCNVPSPVSQRGDLVQGLRSALSLASRRELGHVPAADPVAGTGGFRICPWAVAMGRPLLGGRTSGGQPAPRAARRTEGLHLEPPRPVPVSRFPRLPLSASPGRTRCRSGLPAAGGPGKR